MSNTLMVNEIFYSIQGEGTRMGFPCVFVRLTGCHLRCHYCDTAYAFYEGNRQRVDEVVAATRRYNCPLVEVTGGEPLLQPAVHELMTRLCDTDATVLVETSGACDVATCDDRVIRIMDIKTPGSGEANRNLWANVDHLTVRDEVKFVICNRSDYEWARGCLTKHNFPQRVAAVLFSPAAAAAPGPHIAGVDELGMVDLAQWIMEDRLPVRLQPQLHKTIWDVNQRGV